jgi:hypothetical protein
MSNIQPEELQALIQRIINSGELGRSKTYTAILNYLVECSLAGNSPKEIAIAIDVLGRDADFDVAKDSIVRVHIYHLRNKLKAYYIKHGKSEQYRIDIPKGQYIITTVLNEDEIKEIPPTSITGKELNRNSFTAWLAGLAVILLVVNLFVNSSSTSEPVLIIEEELASSPPALWEAILDDQNPVLIVIGDYYIFGELDEGGNVSRMVREFNINSLEDLEFEKIMGTAAAENYFNLDLSYIPTSTAFAMAQIMPMLADSADRVSVKMMSELNTVDLAENHIIYLGYLSGLGNLEDLLFASSNLYVGGTYDELFHLETNELFSSSSGLSIGEESFQDYGLLSTFPSPNGHQFILIAGMRDEGLINVSQEATDFASLQTLELSLQGVGNSEISAYEALYEVFGFDNTNFDANLVHSNTLDTDVIWETRLIGIQAP